MKSSAYSLCTLRTFFFLFNTWSSLSKMSSAVNTVFLSRFSVMDSMPYFRQIIQSSFDVKHLVRSSWSDSFRCLIFFGDVMNLIDDTLLLQYSDESFRYFDNRYLFDDNHEHSLTIILIESTIILNWWSLRVLPCTKHLENRDKVALK
jgi:hypothetical protein